MARRRQRVFDAWLLQAPSWVRVCWEFSTGTDGLGEKITTNAGGWVQSPLPYTRGESGMLSGFAASRVRWADRCVLCTSDLAERRAQAFLRYERIPLFSTRPHEGHYRSARAILRADGFRVCWVCVEDYLTMELDARTVPLPENVLLPAAPPAPPARAPEEG